MVWPSRSRVEGKEKNIVLSQCFLSKTIERGYKPVTGQNLYLKLNAKRGGCNWRVEPVGDPDARQIVLDGNTMFLGMETMHPRMATDGDIIPSVASLVGNVVGDQTSLASLTRYQYKIPGLRPDGSIRPTPQDNFLHLQDAFTELLGLWVHKSATRLPPSSLIIFRDGLTEANYSKVPLQPRSCPAQLTPLFPGQRGGDSGPGGCVSTKLRG